MKVGDIVVEKPRWYYKYNNFYRIKKQGRKWVILKRLKDVKKLVYSLTVSNMVEVEYIKVTNEVIGSCRVEKEALISDFEVYDQNKAYKTVIYDYSRDANGC